MTIKVFVTGATGYIGGDALYAIVQAHPEYEIACLVRNSEKGAQVASQYSKIRLVYGDLDDAKLLEQEAEAANIVLHCANADHEGAASALVRGLASRSDNQPGFLIHTSGTGILLYGDLERQTFGEANSKVYNDWDGIGEVTSLPDQAPHRKVDKIILEGAKGHPFLKTAIVCPPTIIGPGRGPGNQRSHQLPELCRCILQEKRGIAVEAGKAYWTHVQVADLSDCFLKLVEAAAEGGGKASWNDEGYYFTENGDLVWGEIAKTVASFAHKQELIPSDEVVSVSAKEADKLTPLGSAMWGANSRGRAIRARKLLGWIPSGRSIDDEIPYTLSAEAKRLGLVEGHAAKVTG